MATTIRMVLILPLHHTTPHHTIPRHATPHHGFLTENRVNRVDPQKWMLLSSVIGRMCAARCSNTHNITNLVSYQNGIDLSIGLLAAATSIYPLWIHVNRDKMLIWNTHRDLQLFRPFACSSVSWLRKRCLKIKCVFWVVRVCECVSECELSKIKKQCPFGQIKCQKTKELGKIGSVLMYSRTHHSLGILFPPLSHARSRSLIRLLAVVLARIYYPVHSRSVCTPYCDVCMKLS